MLASLHLAASYPRLESIHAVRRQRAQANPAVKSRDGMPGRVYSNRTRHVVREIQQNAASAREAGQGDLEIQSIHTGLASFPAANHRMKPSFVLRQRAPASELVKSSHALPGRINSQTVAIVEMKSGTAVRPPRAAPAKP